MACLPGPWGSCDPMDCSPPGSSVHGITQARILEYRCFIQKYTEVFGVLHHLLAGGHKCLWIVGASGLKLSNQTCSERFVHTISFISVSALWPCYKFTLDLPTLPRRAVSKAQFPGLTRWDAQTCLMVYWGLPWKAQSLE